MSTTCILEAPSEIFPDRTKQTTAVSSDRAHWDRLIGCSRIIAAVRKEEKLVYALDSPVEVVYLLYGNPLNLRRTIETVRKHGKLPLVNVDLVQGLSRDASAVEYLAQCGAAGVISTNQETLRATRANGLISVLRTFTIDTSAVEAGRRFLSNFQPDAVEMLPAIAAPLVVDKLRAIHPAIRIIAGGLVQDLQMVVRLIDAGIDAVSIGDPGLWVI
ncbi:glycerol-3-phosphate responsive antiterminator [Granulicella mallensis]|uniref:Glycerol-3-phosphate responsive antiterminator, GlpP n=1 Tax=Granulicella mallensis (strain ATCC BAA-1857 / DSM 23137 / MP5ACTX8) TaxID=682795 RepID=G8NP91_GRAMM|nr:glycerol-3-phosphate responsive antiterminator [Granulicella mallensis]AEU38290.1 glycerol-3-phosphate responsive antiterminator, GlpP [Granulicella mallensis MP5ACTX8]